MTAPKLVDLPHVRVRNVEGFILDVYPTEIMVAQYWRTSESVPDLAD